VTAAPRSRRLPAIPLAAALALAYAIAAIIAVTPSATTTYAGASPAARVADLAAGLGLIAAGLLAWSAPATRRFGALSVLAGAAWFAPDWEGWASGPSLVRSLGATAAPFLLAIMLHLVLGLPSGRLRAAGARATAACGYVAAAAAAAGLALLRDPLYDLYCWRDCTANAFLVHSDQRLAQAFADFWLWASLVLSVAITVVALVRLAHASPAGRRRLWPALAPAAVAGGAFAAYAVSLLHDPVESPTGGGDATLFLIRAGALAVVAAGLGWSAVRAARTRAAVTRLARELGDAPPPGKLEQALGDTLGAGRLDVVYPLGDGRFVDGRGQPSERPSMGNGRAVTTITRAGRAVALVGHDRALLEGGELGAATTLALENERLQAEVLAQLDDLRTSRRRIVASGDAARRRLERDLHDGAQQRLLALSYDLRLARAAAASDGSDGVVAVLDDATAQTQAALGQLRELAHGIYPVVLAEAGLAAALESLADTASLPLDLGEMSQERFDSAVETAAYITVIEGLDDAAARGATYVTGCVVREGDRLVIELRDDGSPRSSAPPHPADRIGALGGSLEARPASLRAEIPCG